jgi:N-acetyl-1-D-myo-inositol-2-amino-2-deoxy-alpha-D-glucopyranoside deacetylase
MASDDQDLNGRSLLAVFSHPDDESLACGGLLACCAEYGVRVTLVCATRGEFGPNPTAREALRDVRSSELAEAARILDIAEVVLLDHADGYLPWIEASRVEAEILDVIERVRPEVVITFGADGLYWHPDHIAIHHRTTAAVASLGADAPALYYVTMPPGRMRGVAENGARGSVPVPALFGITDPDAFGAGAEPPTLVVDVSAFAARKLAALRCHRTQLAEGPVTLMTETDAARLFGTEHFHRAEVGAHAPSFLERFGAPATIEAS